MNHIIFRRLSIVSAATCSGALMFVLLIYTISFQQLDFEILSSISNVENRSETSDACVFPMIVRGTPLSVELLVSYDGIDVESNGQEHVWNVASVLLQNTGSCMIENACIVLYTQDGELIFMADRVPAGETVLVLEFCKKEYTDCHIDYVLGFAKTTAKQDPPIAITEEGMSEIVVRNQSKDKVENIVIYHKSYLPVDDIYIGGQSYRTYIDCLKPGESIHIQPEHYTAGYSRVVSVEFAS